MASAPAGCRTPYAESDQNICWPLPGRGHTKVRSAYAWELMLNSVLALQAGFQSACQCPNTDQPVLCTSISSASVPSLLLPI